GEGLFLNTLTGPGTVILQTMPLSKLRRQLQSTGSLEATENPAARLAKGGVLGATVGGILGGILGKGDE
ncbi:TIGR00266 family protein, partial [Candidatus Pacearchaeota archaeon]